MEVLSFISDDNVQMAVVLWFRQHPKEFSTGILCQLVHQWESYQNASDDLSLLLQ
jgi:hypothetical protein